MVGGDRGRIEVHVAGKRVRCKTGYNHLSLWIDVDCLPVDAACHVSTMIVMAHPPLVTVRPAGQGRVCAVFGELWLAAAHHYVGDYRCGHDLLALPFSAKPHHLAEARHVTRASASGRRRRTAFPANRPRLRHPAPCPAATRSAFRSGRATVCRLHARRSSQEHRYWPSDR